MKIAIDLHFSNLKDGLYTDMGSEGRWAARWAELLAKNGQEVYCLNCERPVSSSISNVHIEPRITENKYDIALLPGAEIPRDLRADLYMFMHFSPCTIVSDDREMYKPDNHIIVYPFKIQFFSTNLINRYERKTYFMPTPVAENFTEPDFNRLPSIAWTARFGPGIFNDKYFHAFIQFAKIHNLHTRIFSYQNFYKYIREHEYEEGARKIEQQLDSLQSTERISSIPVNQLIEKLKITKFTLNTHGSGMGGSMTEQVASGAFPLPAQGTFGIFPHIDLKLYNNPYPDTMDGIIKNWEIPLHDRSFYISGIKTYQKDLEPHLYGNCINEFSKIISNYGFRL